MPDLEVFGQDYNDQAYAICGSDMMIKGQSMDNIRFGNSFTEDLMPGRNSTTCWPIRPSGWSGSRKKTHPQGI